VSDITDDDEDCNTEDEKYLEDLRAKHPQWFYGDIDSLPDDEFVKIPYEVLELLSRPGDLRNAKPIFQSADADQIDAFVEKVAALSEARLERKERIERERDQIDPPAYSDALRGILDRLPTLTFEQIWQVRAGAKPGTMSDPVADEIKDEASALVFEEWQVFHKARWVTTAEDNAEAAEFEDACKTDPKLQAWLAKPDDPPPGRLTPPTEVIVPWVPSEKNLAFAKRLEDYRKENAMFDAARAARAEAASAANPEPSKPAAEPKESAGRVAPKSARTLEDMTQNIPGLVGDVIDWICDTSRRPNRVLALGTALTVVGTMLGRKVATPTKSATHLYVVGLAGTAAGKQHPMDCGKLLMRAAGASQHIGTSEFISGPAVVHFLEYKPLAVCFQDEFGAFLSRINAKKASGFETQISKLLREMWGLNFVPYNTPTWAGRESITIETPALSLFGMSAPEPFYQSLKSGNLPDGFLNRFLVLSTSVRADDQDPVLESSDVPDSIANRLKSLYQWRCAAADIAAHAMSRLDLVSKKDIRPWASDAAKQAHREFTQSNDKRIKADESIAGFIGRSSEMATRLATIRAAGRWGHCDFMVDESDIKWAIDVVRIASENLIAEVGANMVEEYLTHGELHNKVVELIRKAKGGGLQRQHLLRKVQKRAKARELDEVVKQLIESGTIEKELGPTPPAGGDRPV
jgi:Protein of unknown function (DUF3987)